ncbi:HAMP domain-containing protein [Halomonas sediminis]
MLLRNRIILIICLASGLTMTAMMVTVYQLLLDDYESLVAEHESSSLADLSHQVEQGLQQSLIALESVSWRLVDSNTGTLYPLKELEAIMQQSRLANDRFPDGLLIFDADATAIAENIHVPGRLGTNYADRAHFRRLFKSGGPIISEPIIGRTTGLPLLSFLVPVLSDEGKRLGIVGGVIDLSKNNILPEGIDENWQDDNTFLIVDVNNRLFVSMQQKFDEVQPLPPPGQNALVDAASRNLHSGQVTTADNQRYVVVTRELADLGWVMLRAIPYQRAIAPALKSFANFSIISLFVAITVAMIGWWVARSLTRPLEYIAQRIDSMADDPSEVSILTAKGGPEIQSLTRAMNRLAKERQAVDRLKDDFISSVSHELRTPMTSLHGSLKLLNAGVTGDLPSKARSMIELALRNSERLQLLVRDLLDFNKLISGNIVFERHSFALSELLQQAVNDIGPMAAECGIRFDIHDDQHLDAWADAQRLRQVVDNLLSNAVKHSPQGGEVRITIEPASPERVRVTVSDQGGGVPDEFSPRIFERFAQADRGSKRAATGTGLGLAIARELIMRMDGAIGFYNNKGANFWFELPKARKRQQESQEESTLG